MEKSIYPYKTGINETNNKETIYRERQKESRSDQQVIDFPLNYWNFKHCPFKNQFLIVLKMKTFSSHSMSALFLLRFTSFVNQFHLDEQRETETRGKRKEEKLETEKTQQLIISPFAGDRRKREIDYPITYPTHAKMYVGKRVRPAGSWSSMDRQY